MIFFALIIDDAALLLLNVYFFTIFYIRFWRELYCRWESGLHPRESLSELMVAAKAHLNSLDDHIRLLQKRIKLAEQKLEAPTTTTTTTTATDSSLNNIVEEKNSDALLYNINDNRFSYSKPLQNEVNHSNH